MRNLICYCLLLLMGFTACQPKKGPNQVVANSSSTSWQQKLDSLLPLYGHRNWILVVDKAFPALAASAGMTVINTNADLFSVLRYTRGAVKASTHVKALLFEDKELGFISKAQITTIDPFKDSIRQLFAGQEITPILHDSVFTRISEIAKQFQVLVLKTNSTLAYSSIYFQLDCKYWDGGKETELRQSMKTK